METLLYLESPGDELRQLKQDYPTVRKRARPLSTSTNGVAQPGDIVTIELSLVPENGFVPEPLFDSTGVISFVLGWGNYLPGLHELVQGTRVGDSVSNVAIDAGWGERQEELVVTIPKDRLLKFADALQVGQTIRISGIDVVVVAIDGDSVVIDGNAPLAGASYACSFQVLAIDRCSESMFTYHPLESSSMFAVATFALGCFWGADLAFMRHPGVVGTKVGYSQGMTRKPTYQQVCQGKTQHREAVMVVFDVNVVSYEQLVHLALERLAITSSPGYFQELFDEDSVQYRHGFYYHTDAQRRAAQAALSNHDRFGVELLEATTFYDAEESHQKYLYKGGQSARKGAKEVIRCYG